VRRAYGDAHRRNASKGNTYEERIRSGEAGVKEERYARGGLDRELKAVNGFESENLPAAKRLVPFSFPQSSGADMNQPSSVTPE